jgi:hypothetical protein
VAVAQRGHTMRRGEIRRHRTRPMQLHSPPTFPSRSSPKATIPYSSAALRQDLERVRGIWEDCQATRDRDAIYGYLSAVYSLVAVWGAEGRDIDRARRALRLQRLAVSDREAPFAAIIRCTADPAKADKRTRSKWSRMLRYAAGYKSDSEPLDQFIRRKGGINACAARYSRCLGGGRNLAYPVRCHSCCRVGPVTAVEIFVRRS